MLDFETLKLYKIYLNTIQGLLDRYFDSQKEYICCEKGCSKCCESGTYPYSKIEFDYLLLGYMSLPSEEQQKIFERVDKLKEILKGVDDKRTYMYRCPFLNDEGLCSVYDFRGLICRTFGLLVYSDDGNLKIPFCHSLGLNYSKVYDKESNMILPELVEREGYKIPPKAYNMTLKALMDKGIFVDDIPEFGEIKSLIEWL